METLRIKKNNIVSIKGQADITIAKGTISTVGANLNAGFSFIIPEGKRIPVTAVTDVELELKQTATTESVASASIPQDWEELVQRIYRNKAKVVLILGQMDTGKSFLATYLANRLLEHGMTPAVVDCDLGQSDIGPPGAMGMAVIDRPVVFLHQLAPKEVYFVGAHSPSLHMIEFLNGIQRLVHNAEKYADTVIINTTGWIHADGGRLLKIAKIRRLNPDLTVLLQRADELCYLEKSIILKNAITLKVSHKATETSQPERKQLREYASMAYFNASTLVEIPFEQFVVEGAFFKTGQELPPRPDLGIVWAERIYELGMLLLITDRVVSEQELAAFQALHENRKIKICIQHNAIRGVLIGLLDSYRNCLGLGILRKLDFVNRKLIIRAPCLESAAAVGIRFGSVRYYANGRELGYLEPGTF